MRTKVKLESTSSGTLSVLADRDGAFRFKNLSPGSYTVVIDGGEEYETVREPIYIDGNSTFGAGARMPMMPRTITVPIYLQLKSALLKSGTKPGVVDVSLANVPKSAVDLYNRGLVAADSGNSKKAVEEFEKAVDIHPEFAIALVALGAEYLKLGNPLKATSVLGKACKIETDNFHARLYYGIALLNVKRFAEAEKELRAALVQNDKVPTAHMYLGISLISQKRLDEAQQHLETSIGSSSTEVGLSHKYLGGIYWAKREYRRAADELELYLRMMPNAADAEKTRAAIKYLRSKQ